MPSARSGPVISFDAVQHTRQNVRPIQDRIVYEIDVSRIVPSPRNPRDDLGDIAELADNIEAFDLLQPVLVRPLAGDQYELVAGHRRFAAVQRLGRSKIAAVVRIADDDQAYLLTLAENLARKDLTPAEEAAGLAVLVRQHGWSLREVAGAIHKSPAYVSQRLRVFQHQDLRAPVLEQQLSVSSAEELLRVPAPLRLELIDQAVRERWTPAQARTARLLARAKCLESKNLTTDARPPIEERLHAMRAELSTLDPADLSQAVRREAVRLLDVLRALVGASATASVEQRTPENARL